MKKFTDIKGVYRKINESSYRSFEVTTEIEIEVAVIEECGVVKFFSKLFESREKSHIFHLQAKGSESSLVTHLALETYYDDIVDLIDDLIEIYQGQYGIVEGYEILAKGETPNDVIEYFEELALIITKDKNCISNEDTHLHSIIDDIVSLIYKTLYKLKFLK